MEVGGVPIFGNMVYRMWYIENASERAGFATLSYVI